MYKPLSLFIGMRYTRSKKRNRFVSFISMLSVLGIALGVMVLITVLSVMNGFDKQIQEKVFSMVPSITISSYSGEINDWRPLLDKTMRQAGIKATAPIVSGQGLLQSDNNNVPVYINGILPTYSNSIIELDDKMTAGKLDRLTAGEFGIVIGQGIAYRLNVMIGDKVLLITPQLNVSPMGIVPRLKRFTVAGIFHASGGFGYDESLAFINLHDAQTLYQLNDTITSIQVKLIEPYNTASIEKSLRKIISDDLLMSDWTNQYGNFFQAIKMEKNMMFFILMLIITIAVFNLVSMLVMVVNEKQADIAILKTYGASNGMILRIFIIQGLTLGILGTCVGIIAGVILSLNITRFVDFLEGVFHRQFISSDVYIVDYLPSHLQWSDVWHISLISLSLSLLATIYPAWRGAAIQPAMALRHE